MKNKDIKLQKKEEYLKQYSKLMKSYTVVICGKLTKNQQETNETLEPLLEELEEIILENGNLTISAGSNTTDVVCKKV